MDQALGEINITIFLNQETLKLHNLKCHNAWSTFPLEGYFDKQ